MKDDEPTSRFNGWRDSELKRHLERAQKHGREGWVHTAAACFLVFCGPLIAWLPLQRAAETSSAWEIALWMGGLCAAGLAAIAYRSAGLRTDYAQALQREIDRRGTIPAGKEAIASGGSPLAREGAMTDDASNPPVARSRFPPRGTKRYQVVSYDVSDEPAGDAITRLQGEFDTAEEALACARAVVDRDLAHLSTSCKTAADLASQFSNFGEGAMIFGEPRQYFNPYAYAQDRAGQLFPGAEDGNS